MTCVKFVFGRVEAVFRPLIVSIQFWKTEIKTTSLRSDHGAVSCLVSSFTLQDFTTIKMLTCICRNNIIESRTTGAKPVALLGSLVSQHFLVGCRFQGFLLLLRYNCSLFSTHDDTKESAVTKMMLKHTFHTYNRAVQLHTPLLDIRPQTKTQNTNLTLNRRNWQLFLFCAYLYLTHMLLFVQTHIAL